MGSGGITRKNIDQWGTWGQRTIFTLSEPNLGKEKQITRLRTKLQLTTPKLYQQHLQGVEKEKKKAAKVKSSREYKKRTRELAREKTLKRKERTEKTKSEGKEYKNAKQKTQPLEELPVFEIHCPVIGCTHKKPYKSKAWLKRHIEAKHSKT